MLSSLNQHIQWVCIRLVEVRLVDISLILSLGLFQAVEPIQQVFSSFLVHEELWAWSLSHFWQPKGHCRQEVTVNDVCPVL